MLPITPVYGNLIRPDPSIDWLGVPSSGGELYRFEFYPLLSSFSWSLCFPLRFLLSLTFFLTGVTRSSSSKVNVFDPFEPGFLLYPSFWRDATSLIRLSDNPCFDSFYDFLISLNVFALSSWNTGVWAASFSADRSCSPIELNLLLLKGYTLSSNIKLVDSLPLTGPFLKQNKFKFKYILIWVELALTLPSCRLCFALLHGLLV